VVKMAGNTGASSRGAASNRPAHEPSAGAVEHASPQKTATVPAQATEPGRRQVRALFTHSLDSILLADDDAGLIEANPAACELTGYSRAELFSKNVWDLTPRDDLAAIREFEFLETGEFAGDFTLVRAQQRFLRLQTLADIDRAILRADSPQAVADAAPRSIAQLVPCARASVGLFDPVASSTRILAVWTTRPSSRGRGIDIPLSGRKGLDALLDGHDVAVSDIVSERDPSTLELGLLAEGLRAFLCVPRRQEDHPEDIALALHVTCREGLANTIGVVRDGKEVDVPPPPGTSRVSDERRAPSTRTR
jgi:hypothetical protein